MRVLLLCDDHYHPGQVPVDGVAPLREQGYSFDIISDANQFKPAMLTEYPAVLLVKCDHVSQQDNSPWKTKEVQEAFVRYVENGGGLVAVHSATVAGKQTEAMDKLLGCKFTYHPADCPVLVQPLKPHPVTEGVNPFTETDEHYRIQILADDADILAASYSAAQGEKDKYEAEPYFNTTAWISPAAIVRSQDKGRVCVLTPGHLPNVWLNPDFKRMLTNALNWCAGGFL
jgi:type 1 glutamine amidotransferase